MICRVKGRSKEKIERGNEGGRSKKERRKRRRGARTRTRMDEMRMTMVDVNKREVVQTSKKDGGVGDLGLRVDSLKEQREK
jgi:hypothetical protein